MPSHPTEETAKGNITDKIAKESKDSTASEHDLHDHGHTKAHALHHSKGPVVGQDIGEPASKEELKKRSEELNK